MIKNWFASQPAELGEIGTDMGIGECLVELVGGALQSMVGWFAS